jgi:phage I-like protein
VEDLRSELAEKDYELTSALDTIHERTQQLDEATTALAKLSKANAALTNERDLSTSSSRCLSTRSYCILHILERSYCIY